MTRSPGHPLLLLFATFLPATAANGSDTPADYRIRARVTPVAGASIQRVELPGAVLAVLQRADRGDLRLFDARGRSVPIALIDAPPARERTVALEPLPIIGAASTLAVAGLSLRLEDRDGAPVARVDGAARVNGAAGEDGRASVVGALLDARRMTGTARTLVIEVGLPAGQPVTLTVEASRDLRTWRTVAERVAYHPAAAPTSERFAMDDASLAQDWLRITWRASTRLVAPVTVRRAMLAVVPDGMSSLPLLTVRMPAPPDARALDLALPFASRLAAVSIAPTADAIVPFRLSGRIDAEQPWVPLGSGTAARIGGVDRSRAIVLAGPTPRLLRVEADAKSDGFVDGATVDLRFDPAGVAFASKGAPLTLAAGRADGEDRSLPLASLLAGGGTVVDTLPEARLDAVTPAPPNLLPPPYGAPWRAIGLWSALLGATALLGWLAWRLARQQPVPQDTSST